MELIVIVAVAAAAAFVGGYLLATHIHGIAIAAAGAAARAVTVRSGDVAALNAKVAGLGDQIENASVNLAAHITDTVNSAVAALPQPKA
ncbi:MAG TPA: hypothetical protein VFB45_10405 [Pseudolabrys sp.]|nr:hypothetical protein [Pseudolabrys sp.]